MPSQTVNVIVFGAGIVSFSAALALQARGRSVVVVDRFGEAAGRRTTATAGSSRPRRFSLIFCWRPR